MTPTGLSPHTRGARSTGMFVIWTGGLSPHTRGSRSGRVYGERPFGSIPHTRGSLNDLLCEVVTVRSIPAHAGEPPWERILAGGAEAAGAGGSFRQPLRRYDSRGRESDLTVYRERPNRIPRAT